MGPKPLGYILCFMEVCPLVREIFEGFLLHMDVMAILFMWQSFVHPSHGASTQNLALIVRVVLDVWTCRQTADGGQTAEHGYTISPPGEPLAQVSWAAISVHL